MANKEIVNNQQLKLNEFEDDSLSLYKHTGAIHISSSLTLLQRKAANILQKYAYNDLNKKTTHTARICDVMRDLGWSESSKTNKKLKEAFRKLNVTAVEWNIFGKDKKHEWGTATILSEIKIKDGMCAYEYSTSMRKLLSNPNVYAKLNLLVQRSFRSKYALILWEFLTDAICTSRSKTVRTSWEQVESIRKLLGLKDSNYPAFNKLRAKILDPAINEINVESDLDVKLFTKRNGRNIAFISFEVTKKNSFQLSLELSEDEKTLIDSISAHSPDIDLASELITDFGFSKKNADDLVSKLSDFTKEEIQSALSAVREAVGEGKVRNIVGFTTDALLKAWKPRADMANIVQPTIVSVDSEEDLIAEQMLDKSWKSVRELLKKQLGNAIFRSWLKDVQYSPSQDNVVILLAASNFKRDWLRNKYYDQICQAWKKINPNVKFVNIDTIKE